MDAAPPAITITALDDARSPSARASLLVALDRGELVGPLLSRLDRAAALNDREVIGLVALMDDDVVGLALFGTVAGAKGTATLHGVHVADTVRRRGIGSALLRGIVRLLEPTHRMIVAEVPGGGTADYQNFLRQTGFAEESSIPDFVRDGEHLLIFGKVLQRFAAGDAGVAKENS